MLKSRNLHYFYPLFIIGIFLASIAALTGLQSSSVSAAGCSYDGGVTNKTSPSSYTPYLCLGSANNMRYFQFEVNLPTAIPIASGSSTSAVDVSAVDGSGRTIAFSQENQKKFVSLAGYMNPKLGWPSGGADMASCDANNKDNKIVITATNVKDSTQTQKFAINLCKYNDNGTYVSVAAKNIGPNAEASINGDLCIQRNSLKDNPNLSQYYIGKLEKAGVTKIALKDAAGKVVFSGDMNTSDATYSLGGGKLSIPGLSAGTYTLTVAYNDYSVLQVQNQAAAGFTNTKLDIKIADIKVFDKKATTIPNSGQCFNSTVAGTDGTLSDGSDLTTGASKETCKIDGVGWIICPVMNFMAQIVDGAYGVVANLLTTPSLNTNTTDANNGIYQAWAIMRTFANVAFVIAFLIIIFSQLTSVGIGNYGIKKMLPRLVIAAILVNLSYFICAVSVDLSNIIGGSLKQLFDSVGGQLTTPDFKDASATGAGWTGKVGFLLAGGGVAAALMYAELSILLPGLIAALVAIVTVFLVLTLRQALIIILIVISPLAFVAFLLPNTEDLFTKWRKLFTTLLLMFPIVAFIFGASALASKVIVASDTASFAVQIMGALVAIIPLFITPLLMKAGGGVLNRFGGAINNPNKGPFDAMRKRAGDFRERRQNYRTGKALTGGKVFGGGQFRRAARRGLNTQAAKDAATTGQAAFSTTDSTAAGYANASANSQLATSALNSARNSRITQGLAQPGGNQGVLNSMGGAAAGDGSVNKALEAQTAKAVADAIKDIKLTSEIAPGDLSEIGKQFQAAVQGGDSIKARAMQDMMLTAGGAGINQWRKSVGELEADGNPIGGDVGTELRRHMLENQPGIKAQDASAMNWATTNGKQTLETIRKDSSTWKLTTEEFAGQKESAQNDAISSGAISEKSAKDLYENKQLYDRMSDSIKIKIERISNPSPSPVASPESQPPPTPPPSNYFG